MYECMQGHLKDFGLAAHQILTNFKWSKLTGCGKTCSSFKGQPSKWAQLTTNKLMVKQKWLIAIWRSFFTFHGRPTTAVGALAFMVWILV